MTRETLVRVALTISWASIEALAVARLLSGGAAAAAALHVGSSVLLAAAVVSMLPQRYAGERRRSACLVFAIAAALPVAGGLGCILVAKLALGSPGTRVDRGWIEIEEDGLPSRSTIRTLGRVARQGELIETILHSPERERRIQAILRARAMTDREAVPILRAGLKDVEDEVRLLAYAFLDRKEQKARSTLQGLSAQRAEAEPDERPAIDAAMAYHAWELAHSGLAQGTAREQVLEAARDHALAALEQEPREASLCLLLGRIEMARGDHANALGCFEHAESLGLPASKTRPYIAEAAFAAGDWAGVRRSLEELSSMGRRLPVLAPVQDFWRASEERER